jgi:hypothetical protein
MNMSARRVVGMAAIIRDAHDGRQTINDTCDAFDTNQTKCWLRQPQLRHANQDRSGDCGIPDSPLPVSLA